MAREQGAILYAEPLYRQSEDLIAQGWVEMGKVQGQLWFLRDFSRAESLFYQAELIARQAFQKSLDSIVVLRTTSLQEADSLRAELVQWRSILDGGLIHYDADAWWKRARINLQTAEQLIKEGYYQEAFRHIYLGEQALGRVGQLLTERLNSEHTHLSTWRTWANRLIEHTRREASYGILIVKSERKLYLYHRGERVQSYLCDFGFNPASPKLFAGDGATPEGEYMVDKVITKSRYYKAFHINYPNDQDQRRFEEAKRKGVITRSAKIGGLIEIHGEGGKGKDWTRGCVAVSNEVIDTLFKYVGIGTPVTIVRRL